MKKLAKILIPFLFLLVVTLIFFVYNKKTDLSTEQIDIPDFGMVNVLDNKAGNYDIYKIENNKLNNIGTVKGLQNLVYDINNSVYVYSVEISKGTNFDHNFVQIIKNGKSNKLNDFYCASDMKLSPSGDKVVFRTFKSNSAESAEGMRIYDISHKKYMSLNSKVLVSGNLYEWLDDDRILYYGSIEGQKNSNKIYIYNFKNKKESIYFDKIKGYYMYFKPMDNNLLVFARQIDGDKLYYYDYASNVVKSINGNILGVYNSEFDRKNKALYFLGTQDNKSINLYKFTSENLNISQITYDFPSTIDITAGVAQDNNGSIFFCGTNSENGEKNKDDVFVYIPDQNSINLISDEESVYKVYGSENN